MSTQAIASFNGFNNTNIMNNAQRVVAAAGDTSGYIELKKQSGNSDFQIGFSNPEAEATAPRSAMNLKSAQKLGPEFLAKAKEIASRLGCDYQDLLALMNSESGLNSSIGSKYVGLIQMSASAAASVGTSQWALKSMSPVEQLDYVEKFIMNMKVKAGFAPTQPLSAGELYALVYLPGRARRETLCTKGEAYYNCNKGLDYNHDGKITKTDLANHLAQKSVSDNSFLA
ncbi:MAG: hypothetical protein LKG27_02955 [Clostridiaceae bacterium]|jgi:hypothetical protein|nr:hypothetical protein [Clostridiaceae bacterium]